MSLTRESIARPLAQSRLNRQRLVGNVKAVVVDLTRCQVDAEVMGEDVRVAINARYVLDLCTRLDDVACEIHMTNELSPVVIRRRDEPDFECVIMPTRLSSW